MDIAIVTMWAMRAGVAMVLAAICWSDLRARRIPNKLVGIGLVMAFAWSALAVPGDGLFDWHAPGALSLKSTALGAIYAFAVFFILHLLRLMGAGDVKMMAMVGAYVGSESVPLLIVSVFITGGVLALYWMIKAGSVRARLQSMWLGALLSMSGAGTAGWRPDMKAGSSSSLPYAFAIAGGLALCTVLKTTGLIR